MQAGKGEREIVGFNSPDGARSHQEGHRRGTRAEGRAAHGAAGAAQDRVRALGRARVRSARSASAFARRTALETWDFRPPTHVLTRYS